ncbi:MAG: response regulator [Armatimonadetes bacterium]|nr:response regulator [Armatimonadota bacterium]
MLVDDSPVTAWAVRSVLVESGELRFEYCKSPLDALSTAVDFQPTVILLDLVMPEMDGLALLKRFREIPELKKVPVVMLSGEESPEEKARCFAGGANDYLIKLPHKAELLARVSYHSQAYHNHRQLEEAYLGLRRQNEILEDNQKLRELNRQIEEQARDLAAARDQALEASRAKSAFLANTSHEIRTPMNGIMGLTRLALATELTPVQREYLTQALASAESLLTIINDLLDVSKIEAGMLNFDPHPFGLRDMLDTCLKSLALRAHAKGLELNFRIEPAVPDHLITDATRLRQVLTNLVGNASKFTHQGEICVRVELQSLESREACLRFSVSDTGVGIPADRLESVFEAFTQADSSTTRKYGGTGLGLTISSHLVEMMGGTIRVESVEGQGSTFSFDIRCPVGDGEVPRQECQMADLRGLRVLVVDDNATNRLILRDMLRSWKMQPTVTGGGEEALAVLEESTARGETFDLILTDAHMPDMDGFGLARALQDDPRFSGHLVMLLTSSSLKGDADRCREAGVRAHLTKPICESELLDMILSLLRPRMEGRALPAPEEQVAAVAQASLKILLAEDNPINQTVATILLEGWGHQVTVANDGMEAVEHFQAGRFDLILMDVQMPRMDGFQAVAAIRDLESGTGARIPIIALTAHALKDDRGRCLEAGMDGYVTKPIQEKEFLAALAGVRAARKEPSDEQGLLDRLSGDPGLRDRVIEQFLETCPALLRDIETAVQEQDGTALAATAHSFRGAVSNFGAAPLVDLSLELETIGSGGQLEAARDLVASLQVRACDFLDRLRLLRRPVTS